MMLVTRNVVGRMPVARMNSFSIKKGNLFNPTMTTVICDEFALESAEAQLPTGYLLLQIADHHEKCSWSDASCENKFIQRQKR